MILFLLYNLGQVSAIQFKIERETLSTHIDRPNDSECALRRNFFLCHPSCVSPNILNLKESSKSIDAFKSYGQKQLSCLLESRDKLGMDLPMTPCPGADEYKEKKWSYRSHDSRERM